MKTQDPDHNAAVHAGEDCPDDHVACVVCGKVVPYRLSRLFFVKGGTIRTCGKGTFPHTLTTTPARPKR